MEAVRSTSRLLIHGLFRRRGMILTLCCSIMGTVILGTLLWTPAYEASSTVVVRGRNYENLLSSEPKKGGQGTLLIKPEEEINSEIEIIRSRPVLERTVVALRLDQRSDIQRPGILGLARAGISGLLRQGRKMFAKAGLAGDPTSRNALEVAIQHLGKRLRVEPVIDSQIIRISYRDPDPVMASEVVNRIADEYLKQHLTINLNPGESAFYGEQVRVLEGELGVLQDKLEKMKTREGIIFFPEQTRMILKNLETFDLARSTAQKEIISKRAKVEKVRAILESRPTFLIPLPEIAQNPLVEDLENKLINLKFNLETLRTRYTEESRQVVTALEQLAQVQAQIREQVSRYLDRELADLRKLEAEQQALTQTIDRLNVEIKTLPAIELALTNLEKLVEEKQAALTLLRKRHQDSLVAQASDWRLENAKIVSKATQPLSPVTPNFALNLILGLVLSLVISFSAALFLDYSDDSLNAPEDVERHLGLPVLGSVPEL